MAEFKLVLNTKDGKSFQKQASGKEAENLLGKNIGDKISGDKIGFAGYEFEITGGSDFAGFPMRKGVKGFGRKKILLGKGTGFSGLSRWKKKKKGIRQKKSVCGETIYPKITQVNMKILKQGSAPLKEKAEEAKEGKKQEKPAEKKEEAPEQHEKPKKPAPKQEAKPEEIKKEAQSGKAADAPEAEKK